MTLLLTITKLVNKFYIYGIFMTYTITSTERNNEKASDHETKAMLYLMNFHQNSDEIKFFVIDFFNDITGIDAHARKAIDVQSKASLNLTGRTIGKYLVTLYKNFISDLAFTDYVLFVGGISPKGLLNSNLKIFGFDNFSEKYKQAITNGLKTEAFSKSYIITENIDEENIQTFLKKVIFVVNDKSKVDYVKEIIKVKDSVIVTDEYWGKIFDQIRDIQSSKKNICCENITINCLEDFHRHKKFLTSEQIKTLVLSRLVGRESINDGIPQSFMCVLAKYNDEIDRREIVDDCKAAINRMLFNKNNARAYWRLFENIYYCIKNDSDQSVDDVYSNLETADLNAVPELDFNSTRFFIALIKDKLA